MINVNCRFSLALVCLFSLLMAANSAFAAPIRFEQVQQVINVKPGKAGTGGYAQLRLAGDDTVSEIGDGDDDDDKTKTKQKDDRVITETRAEIVEDDACDCPVERVRGGFPKWAFLGLAAIPLIFLIKRDKDSPTPTPTNTPSMTPTTTPTTTPTPTMTPTPTTTPTPTMTPTPEPVPEPMTILLFGTGLAGIGVAARRRLRKRGNDEKEEEEN